MRFPPRLNLSFRCGIVRYFRPVQCLDGPLLPNVEHGLICLMPYMPAIERLSGIAESTVLNVFYGEQVVR